MSTYLIASKAKYQVRPEFADIPLTFREKVLARAQSRFNTIQSLRGNAEIH